MFSLKNWATFLNSIKRKLSLRFPETELTGHQYTYSGHQTKKGVAEIETVRGQTFSLNTNNTDSINIY